MLLKLWNYYTVMSSDEDQPIVEDLYVGFDSHMNLIVTIEHTNYEEPEYSCSVVAVVNKENAFELSKRLKVSMVHLPSVICESMEEYTEIVNADFQQVQECFKEITDCFISEKCPYRIVRKYGKHGFICC